MATTPQNSAGEPNLQNFPKFLDLPAELRLKIWHDSLTPRNIGVTLKTTVSTITGTESFDFNTSDPVPAILHICKESRDEALRIYHEIAPSGPEKSGKFYFGTIDCLHIPYCDEVSVIFVLRLLNYTLDKPSNLGTCIHRIAVYYNAVYYKRLETYSKFDTPRHARKYFPELEEITVIFVNLPKYAGFSQQNSSIRDSHTKIYDDIRTDDSKVIERITSKFNSWMAKNQSKKSLPRLNFQRMVFEDGAVLPMSKRLRNVVRVTRSRRAYSRYLIRAKNQQGLK